MCQLGSDHLLRQKKEVLTIKGQYNIPYYEARKLEVSSKTTIYSQAVQLNKSTDYIYERIVKTLIQLNPGYWESFINKIKAVLNTTRTTNASVNLSEIKEESSTQTQTRSREKNDTGEKTVITPTTRPIIQPVTKSQNKTRSKDKRSPILPFVFTDSSPNKKK